MLSAMATVLDRIEAAALGGEVSKALRLCTTLGDQPGSAELKSWATRELEGYDGVPDLPDYRQVRGPLLVDGVSAVSEVRGQRISSSQLPDFAREHISEEIEIRHSIPMLLSLVESAERTNDPILLSPVGAAEIAAAMSDPYGFQVMRLYWAIDASTLRGVYERVCTDVLARVSKMKAAIESDHKPPSVSPDVVGQTIGIAISGDSNRVVTGGLAHSQASSSGEKKEKPSALQKIYWIVGILGVLGGLALAYIQLVAG